MIYDSELINIFKTQQLYNMKKYQLYALFCFLSLSTVSAFDAGSILSNEAIRITQSSVTEVVADASTVKTFAELMKQTLGDFAPGVKESVEAGAEGVEGAALPSSFLGAAYAWAKGWVSYGLSAGQTAIHSYCVVLAPLSPIPFDDVGCVAVHVGGGMFFYNIYRYGELRKGQTMFAFDNIPRLDMVERLKPLQAGLDKLGVDKRCVSLVMSNIWMPDPETSGVHFYPCKQLSIEGVSMKSFTNSKKEISFAVFAENANRTMTFF